MILALAIILFVIGCCLESYEDNTYRVQRRGSFNAKRSKQPLPRDFIAGESPVIKSLLFYPESTNPQEASLQNAKFLLRASGQPHVPGVSNHQKQYCTKYNA